MKGQPARQRSATAVFAVLTRTERSPQGGSLHTRRAAPAMLFPPARFPPLHPPFRASPLHPRNPAGGGNLPGGQQHGGLSARLAAWGLQWREDAPGPKPCRAPPPLRVAGATPPLSQSPQSPPRPAAHRPRYALPPVRDRPALGGLGRASPGSRAHTGVALRGVRFAHPDLLAAPLRHRPPGGGARWPCCGAPALARKSACKGNAGGVPPRTPP